MQGIFCKMVVSNISFYLADLDRSVSYFCCVDVAIRYLHAQYTFGTSGNAELGRDIGYSLFINNARQIAETSTYT